MVFRAGRMRQMVRLVRQSVRSEENGLEDLMNNAMAVDTTMTETPEQNLAALHPAKEEEGRGHKQVRAAHTQCTYTRVTHTTDFRYSIS